MAAKKILFITQEMIPYLPETDVARLCRNLPQGIQDKGKEIRTFLPRYGHVNERRNQLHEVIRLSGMNLIINDTDHPLIIKVASIQAARMQIYFIDNEDFFHHKSIVADENEIEFADNDERAIFYARGVFETVKKLRWIPDVIHCHGWLTALAPIYIKRFYNDDPCYNKAKVIYSIYDDGFENPLNKDIIVKMKHDSIADRDLKILKESTDYAALSSLAIQFSDAIIQGSPQIDNKVTDFLEASNKPFLPYQTEDTCVDTYNDFYDVILKTKK
ncbi:MAG: glycogen/starch synthase [Tannerella sp.]|nr:glycogen/starch synthase [Tannerella sp.]